MMKHVSEKYYNITEDAVKLYIKLCQECQMRRNKKTRKTVIVKPIRSYNFNQRCQVDLIDMRSEADGEFKWILNYQDHFTKFIHLRPLKYKTAEEVAFHIVDIFLTNNGAPLILQTDNGGEFVNDWLKSIAKQWPGMKLVRGRSRYPQSQGSVEAANKEIKGMLGTWRRENNTTKWAERGLSMVQFMKNTSYHQTLKMTPCEALYGKKENAGLHSTDLQPSTFDYFETEEDLQNYLESENLEVIPDDEELQHSMEMQPAESIAMREDGQMPPGSPTLESQYINLGEISTMDVSPIEDTEVVIGQCFICEKELSANNMTTCIQCSRNMHTSCADDDICQRCSLFKSRDAKRSAVSNSQEAAAKRMTADSDKRLAPFSVGENVRIPVDKVDRGLLDHPYMIGVITEKKHGNYKVGTTSGTLNQMFSRSQIDSCPHQFITSEQVPDKVLSVRSANAAQSIGSGQGLVRCICLQGCKNNRCKCKRQGVLCSSYCHKSASCKNKG